MSGGLFDVPETDNLSACDFIDTWFAGCDGYITIPLIEHLGESSAPFTLAMSLTEFKTHLRQSTLDSLVNARERQWNVYLGVSLHSVDPRPAGNPHRKGGEDTVSQVPGVWLDLDVDPFSEDKFPSELELEHFIKQLPFRPTIDVATGSGGRHLYWKFEEGPVDAGTGKRLNEGWWSLCQELAGKHGIDRVFNVDRIMRLPGTIRFGKGSVLEPRLVEVKDMYGSTVGVQQLEDAVGPSYSRHRERVRASRERLFADEQSASELFSGEMARHGWGKYLGMVWLEEQFNETHTWDEILRGTGWEPVLRHDGMHQTDKKGRRFWSRPGSTDKSATTDWDESPNVMSLFSSSAGTKLLRLKESGVPLTKMRVAAELHHGGDRTALIEKLLEELA